MSAFTDDVVSRARHELDRWNGGKGRETEDPFCAYVGEYWAFGLKNAHIDGRTTFQDKRGKLFRPAWSSAFISFVYRRAGAGSDFYYHEGHVHYVVKAIRDAAAQSSTAKFLGRDPRHYRPKPGDLINAGRGAGRDATFADILARYGPKVVPKGAFLPTHSDIVVSVDQAKGELVTVGGNVAVDTVGAKRWKIGRDGVLADADELICVIDCAL